MVKFQWYIVERERFKDTIDIAVISFFIVEF